MDKTLELILRKMCDMVGAEYEKMGFKDAKWYYKHTWTKEQEDEFTEWLADLLYRRVEARRLFHGFHYKTKRRCREYAESFVWNYGWKIKEEN